MNRNLRVLVGLTAGLMLTVPAVSALAQDHPAGPPPAGAWKDHAKHHAEARIHALHDLLGIRPDQEDAFKTFIANMRPPEDHRPPPMGAPGEVDHLTTPERLDRMVARMQERQAGLTARVAATKQFYAALTPEQQKAFDALPMLRMGRHGHGPMGGQGGPGRPGGWMGEGPDGPPPPPPAQ